MSKWNKHILKIRNEHIFKVFGTTLSVYSFKECPRLLFKYIRDFFCVCVFVFAQFSFSSHFISSLVFSWPFRFYLNVYSQKVRWYIWGWWAYKNGCHIHYKCWLAGWLIHSRFLFWMVDCRWATQNGHLDSTVA